MIDREFVHQCSAAMDRRAFVRQAAVAAGAVLVGLGATPAQVAAVVAPVRVIDASATDNATSLRAYTVPAVDGASVDIDNEVLIVRWAGTVYAFALACPHRGMLLRWESAGSAFCPKHKARFAPDGANVGGRKTRALDRYPVQLDGARIMVDLSARVRADADTAAWTAASAALGRR